MTLVDLDLWLAYAGTVLVIVISPGPSVLLVSSHRMQHGPGATLPTIAGDLTANVIQMFVASVGLVAVIQRSAVLVGAIKWIGVGYLLWLGVQRILRRSRSHPIPTQATTLAGPVSTRRLYLRGFLVSAANPKAVVFFAGLFPLFLVPDRAWAPQLMILGATFVLLDGTALALYAHVGSRFQDWLARHHRAHWEDWVSGGLLIGAGAALAAKRLDPLSAAR